VAALVRAGATYYSDEYAVFDPRGRVHPYPKPLSLRDAAGERQRKCRVEELGGRAGTQPLPVGLIVATPYQPGAPWHPRNLSPGRAVLMLMEHTVLARLRPAFALATLQRVVSGAATLQGSRREAQEVAGGLLDVVA
jgi:hypothetical protein